MESLSSLTGNKIALLIDFDNVILGVDDPGFDVEIVVNALRSRGSVVMGRAYGDWYRHHRHRRKLMEQGIELVETPVFGPLIKNSADIRIVLDGFEIAMSQSHINTFCLVSGDSDFLPLIKKLQFLGKHVIVIAGIKFTSDLIRRNCNEYISYENLYAESVGATEDISVIEGAYMLLDRAINTLNERIMDVRSSSVKQMMMQLNPAFSERSFGCSQFKQFLERAARDGYVTLEARDGSAGESSVYWREDAPRPEPKPLPPVTPKPIAHGPLRDAERPAGERRDLSTAKRSGRKFSGRSGRLQSDAPDTAETPAVTADAPQIGESLIVGDVEVAAPVPELVTPTALPVEDDFAAATPPNGGFVNALAQRSDLRRGRLRFSAKNGTSSIAPVASASTVEIQPVSSEAATEESLMEATTEETAPKKRTTRRGGRTRKKKDATENADATAHNGIVQAATAEVAPEAAVEALVEVAPTETAQAEAAKSETAQPADAPKKRTRTRTPKAKAAPLEESAPVASEVNLVTSDVEAAEDAPKKATRARRGGTKRTAARKKSAEGAAEESSASPDA